MQKISEEEESRLQALAGRHPIDVELYTTTAFEEQQKHNFTTTPSRLRYEIQYHPLPAAIDQNITSLLLSKRQLTGALTRPETLQLYTVFTPLHQKKHVQIIETCADRMYCGEFNPSGDRFLLAGQSLNISIFDTTTWKKHTTLAARDVQWTITDAHFVPTLSHSSVLYSTISPIVRLATESKDVVFDLSRQMGHSNRFFGVWTIALSESSPEFLAGTSHHSVQLHDMQAQTTTGTGIAQDDINSTCFLDPSISPNVFLAGSDDCLIYLWDKRMLGQSSRPQGIFQGHTEGITHISSRKDGCYFISNAKDQTCKLWDLRKMEKPNNGERFRRQVLWDYRFEQYPLIGRPPTHPNDQSIMTYRGHVVLETLIRAYFSPAHTTAQQYIITGSADGHAYIFDVLTGKVVQILSTYYHSVTRDIRWHPYLPMIASADFRGRLYLWHRETEELAEGSIY